MLYFVLIKGRVADSWFPLKECSSLEEGQEMVTKLMPRLDTRDITGIQIVEVAKHVNFDITEYVRNKEALDIINKLGEDAKVRLYQELKKRYEK